MSVGPEDQIRALTEQLQQLQAVNTRLQQEAAVQPNAVAGQGGGKQQSARKFSKPEVCHYPKRGGNAQGFQGIIALDVWGLRVGRRSP